MCIDYDLERMTYNLKSFKIRRYILTDRRISQIHKYRLVARNKNI